MQCAYGFRFKDLLGYILAHHYDRLCGWMDSMHPSRFGTLLKGEPGVLGLCSQGAAGYWLRLSLQLPGGREVNNLFAAVCLTMADMGIF